MSTERSNASGRSNFGPLINPWRHVPLIDVPQLLADALRSPEVDANEFKKILRDWLVVNGIAVPSGVFVKDPGSPGQPQRDDWDLLARYGWRKSKQPDLTMGQFAREVDPEGYAMNRKQTADRIRSRIRAQERKLGRAMRK